jgi:hypothetical protein
MRFSKRNKDKRKTKQTIPDSNSNLAKSMTHHNQTKERTTWFLRLARHDLSMVDYKALTGLSLLWVPHIRARRGASLQNLNLDTTFTSKTKGFLISR